jgi:hypothetical protein
MKSFRDHLYEAVVSKTRAVKGARKPRGYAKTAKATLDRLRAETTYDGTQYADYLSTGHDNPNARWLAKWGLPPTTSVKALREYLPLLWWWDGGKIVVWEIPPDQSAQDVVHGEIPEYIAAANKARHASGMTDYQGRVDRFRKTVSLISAITGQNLLRDRALQRGKNRVKNNLARMFPGYTVLDMDVEGELREGVEHGDTPKPKPEYFIRPFSIGGKIVQLHPVFGIPVKGREYMRKRFRIGDREGFSPYVDSPGQKAYDIKMSVWRWRVRIQTDEGWMLMGYIGRSDRKESLPPIRMGDRVEVSDLVLSSMTGGNLVTTALGWRGYGDTQYSEKQVDYRSRRFDRQLHGKVKRKAP